MRRLAAILLLLVLPACGAASRGDWGGSASAAPVAVTSPGSGAAGGYYGGDAEGGAASDDGSSQDYRVSTGYSQTNERYAQNAQPDAEPTATDATAQPLLIYTAELGLAVHHVTEKQDQVEALARELGGHLSSRTNDAIVIRVPARAFDGAMAQIQALGDVVSRHIQVQDVSEEFHDVEVRIQTLEAMRRRVEELLRQANDVEAALAVEQQLERITLELERLRGRLRFLSDRVAFSTITVRFQERTEAREPQFRLPFPWLDNLGLQRLLQL